MNVEDSWLIARFQRLITELLIEKELGQRRRELADELYQTWQEVDQHGLKETPAYRNVLLTADRHALWLAGLVKLTSPVRPLEVMAYDAERMFATSITIFDAEKLVAEKLVA